MRKHFNTTGTCYSDEHYMVDIHRQLEQIKEMIDQGNYFCINRARQYGKTRTLSLLKNFLEDEYTIFSISFEGIGTTAYESDETLSYAFLCLLNDCLTYNEVKQASQPLKRLISEAVSNVTDGCSFIKLSRLISQICTASDKPVILFIDESDQAGNYNAFLEFLGLLRDKYLKRRERPTFWSVILASVYDSPWNIAAEFDIDMNFSKNEIERMLLSYEEDCQTGMNVSLISRLLYDYTSGYPFLVSRLCKIIDEKLPGTKEYPDHHSAWSQDGFQTALRLLLSESNTLFDDMQKKIYDNPCLKKVLYELLYEGQTFLYNTDDRVLNIGEMFGYLKDDKGKVMVANRIFETRLYNLFISEEHIQSAIFTEGSKDRNLFIQDGQLNMRRILERFIVHFTDLYGQSNEAFIEKVGRKFFLFYLKPIINGTGNYYVEAQTRDEKRTDIIVDYLVNNLSFNFNKKKEIGIKEIRVGNKLLIEAIV